MKIEKQQQKTFENAWAMARRAIVPEVYPLLPMARSRKKAVESPVAESTMRGVVSSFTRGLITFHTLRPPMGLHISAVEVASEHAENK